MNVESWDLLEGFPEAEVEEILSLSSSRTVPEGTIIFGLGDEATDLFLVGSGLVKLTLPLRVGGETSDALVEERMPGQLLGWSALVPPYRYTLQAYAPVATELLSLPRDDLLSFLAEHPSVGYRVFSNLAKVIGQRLQISQTMWIREMQRVLSNRDG